MHCAVLFPYIVSLICFYIQDVFYFNLVRELYGIALHSDPYYFHHCGGDLFQYRERVFCNLSVRFITLVKHCYSDYLNIRAVIRFHIVTGISQSSAADLFACDSVFFNFVTVLSFIAGGVYFTIAYWFCFKVVRL